MPADPRAPAKPPRPISTVATPGADDDAAYVSGSPSGSEKLPDTATLTAPSGRDSVCAGSVPTATGDRFGTVTANVCVAGAFDPVGSVAVTVTVDAPAASGVSVTTGPETDTAATAGADETTP